MDELTQQNAALVGQAVAASESMGEQAQGMNQMMDFFTVSGNGAHAKLAAPGSPPGGVERRSADRPWSTPKTAEANEQVAAPPLRGRLPRATMTKNGKNSEMGPFGSVQSELIGEI